MDEKLLKQRKATKAKKPEFTRQDSHKKARINSAWRRPKGIQSKMRLGKAGYKKRLKIGYGSPKAVKGLSAEGLVPVRVESLADLKVIVEGQGALISSSVGQKKRAEIAKRANDLGIKILNIKDVSKYIKEVSKRMQEKKEKKQKAMKDKEKKREEKEKKAKEKKEEDLAEKLTDEEKKEQEKKERDKVLTKKEM